MRIGAHRRFAYHQSMNAADPDAIVAPIAAAIGEPARARMVYCLLDGRARTSTELAIVADVTPSTASVHLQRLKAQRLVKVVAQGKHRYYSLDRPEVAVALEALSVVAGGSGQAFTPSTPDRLRGARTCYDHIAGALGVAWYERLLALDWLRPPSRSDGACDVTATGRAGFAAIGIDADRERALRRRFAFACLDWSERRPHLGGALGAALLRVALQRRWVAQDLDSRVLRVTRPGQRELLKRFGLACAGLTEA
jgi:DNA-binding transcriptional ArsR family regulator